MNKKIIIAILVLLVIGGGWWLFAQLTRPLPGLDVADQGRKHVDEKVWGTFKYNSNPPTSGPHDPVWTTKGIYTKSSVDMGKGHLLHSLEHGYIEMHYNCDSSSSNCKNLVKQITDIANKKTLWKMIVVPNPTINSRLVLAAWDRIDPITPANPDGTLNGKQKTEVEDFIDSFRDHGPEQTMEP